jgi:MGT family glycosyltransferase
MPKALFFNVPGHGHVNPTLPLVAELSRRGHRITYFVTEGFRTGVEVAGATFRTYTIINDDYFDIRGLSGSVPQRVAHALISTTAEILPDLLDITRAEQPDYILFDGMCPWGSLVARIVRRPSVASLALLPVASMPPGVLLKLLPLILPLIFKDFRIGLEANHQAKTLTQQYHLPPLGLMGIMNNLGDLSLSYTSAEFQPYSDTVSPSVRFVGWTFNESANNEQFSFERLQGRRLIYVSLGTLNNDDVAFFKACIEAFQGSDNFVIITTGRRISPEVFGVLPENIAIYRWVPQVEVLKRASLFISHGGLNSIHDSLYLGVPLLLVPQQAEQTLNAVRVVELGAGLMLKKRKVNAQTIRTHAARLLADSHFKIQAVQIGDTFRAAGGVTRAADEIERLLKTYKETPRET